MMYSDIEELKNITSRTVLQEILKEYLQAKENDTG